ncbi:ankyrin repeat domain-containing protein [Brasilonema sp. CT11]|nr:ankyrin repeat domain-containing protein [Brasilonema sp. CT11]
MHYLARGAILTLHIEPFLEMVQLLRNHGAEFNVQDLQGCTPFHYLLSDPNVSYRMVNLFIESGARYDGSEGCVLLQHVIKFH